MKPIKYRVSKGENLGLVPEKCLVKAFLLFEGDNDDGLIYFPPELEYYYDDKWRVDEGCGALSFGERNIHNKEWSKSGNDYVNLEGKYKQIFKLLKND